MSPLTHISVISMRTDPYLIYPYQKVYHMNIEETSVYLRSKPLKP